MKIFGGCFLKKHEWQFFLLPALGVDRHGNRITIGFICWYSPSISELMQERKEVKDESICL